LGLDLLEILIIPALNYIIRGLSVSVDPEKPVFFVSVIGGLYSFLVI